MFVHASVWMAAFICLAHGYSQGSLRLNSWWTEDAGYLEVLGEDGSWSVIQDEDWTENDAEVACRELGYATLAGIRSPETFCPLRGEKNVIDGVHCSGTEQAISECNISAVSTSKSTVGPSGISCADEMGLRFANSSDDLSRGLLEIYYEGEWHGVCADGFMSADASATCRQLGFDGRNWEQVEVDSGINSGNGINISAMSYVSLNSTCLEGDPSLRSCLGDVVINNSCIATVQLQCYGPPYPSCPPEVENASCSAIQISWQPPSSCGDNTSSCNITAYTLWYRMVGPSVNYLSNKWQKVKVNSTSALEQSIVGLSPGSLYEVQLQAANSHGNGIYSESILAETLLAVLPIPYNVTVTATSSGSATVSWKVDAACSAVNLIGFWVSYTTSNSSLRQVVLADGNSQQATITGLQPSQDYWFYVQALGCSLEGECVPSAALSGLASEQVHAHIPLPVFSFSVTLSISSNAFFPLAINASWELDSSSSLLPHILGYIVECHDDDSGSFLPSESILRQSLASANAGSLLLPAQGSTSYSCTVTALLAGGIELNSSSEEIRTPAIVLPPSMSLAVTDIGTNQFLLRWQFSGMNLTYFWLQITNDDSIIEKTLLIFSSVCGDQSTCEKPVTGLCPGTTYFVSIAEETSTANGTLASTVAMTKERVPKHSPTDLTYQSPSAVGDSILISLSWKYAMSDSFNSDSCEEKVLGFDVRCQDLDSALELSKVTLAVADSQQHFTTQVAITQELGGLLSGMKCTVAAFNTAGFGNSSEQVIVDLTGFYIDLGVLQNSFLANPYFSLAFLIISCALVLLLVVICIVVCCCYTLVKYCFRAKTIKTVQRFTHSTLAKETSGELGDESYIPMAAASVLQDCQHQKSDRSSKGKSYWIDSAPTPKLTTFETLPPNYTSLAMSPADTGLATSQEDAERGGTGTALGKSPEDDPYDEVASDLRMQEPERTAFGEGKEEEKAMVEVVDSGPKAVLNKDRENVYDEIVNVARISEANSMEGLDISANLPTGADLPPPANGQSQSLSQEPEPISPTLPPPTQFSALPARRSTVAGGVDHWRTRRPAPLPPAASTRRMTTGKGFFQRGQGHSKAASTNSLRRKLIVISSHSTEETDEAAYCNITSQEQPADPLEVPQSNAEWKDSPSSQGSPQYEILIHPKSFSLTSDASSDKLPAQEAANASHKSDQVVYANTTDQT